MKTRLAILIPLLLTASIQLAVADSPPPQPGPENGGLQFRLVAVPHSVNGKEGYDVTVDLLNVTNHPITLRTDWANDEGKGDMKDYIEASTSIESYPAIAPWVGQVLVGYVGVSPRKKPQSEYVLKAGEVLSVRWHSAGRKLKNKVTNPLEVQNPEFNMQGLYSVHATVVICSGERPAATGSNKQIDGVAEGLEGFGRNRQPDGGKLFLRSNEQLVSFGGSREMPKHSYGTLWEVNAETKTGTLSLGSLHKIEIGDQFRIRPGMNEFWKLTVTKVYPDYSVGRIEPLLQVGPNSTNPNPRFPERNLPAVLMPQK